MRVQAPLFDLFIGRDGHAWRLYAAASSWLPPALRDRANEDLEIFPVNRPDLEDLEKFMWETDSPYVARPTADGGAEIRAAGRSAVTLLVWLEDLVSPAPRRRRDRG